MFNAIYDLKLQIAVTQDNFEEIENIMVEAVKKIIAIDGRIKSVSGNFIFCETDGEVDWHSITHNNSCIDHQYNYCYVQSIVLYT